VISELRKIQSGKADRNVARWDASVSPVMTFISVITVMELELGILLIERRDPAQAAILRGWLETRLLPAYTDRTLPVDIHVARRCAALHVSVTRPDRDALIAATALVHGMVVATRNVADFGMPGVQVVNPWDA